MEAESRFAPRTSAPFLILIFVLILILPPPPHVGGYGSWAASQSVSNRPLTMNRAAVAAGVPPAVEGGVSPPGIFPGSWSVSMAPAPMKLSMNPVSTTEAPRHRETRQTVDNSVPRCLRGKSLVGSWSQCAICESWRLSMNLASVAAGVPPAVDGGRLAPPRIPGSRSVGIPRAPTGLPIPLGPGIGPSPIASRKPAQRPGRVPS